MSFASCCSVQAVYGRRAADVVSMQLEWGVVAGRRSSVHFKGLVLGGVFGHTRRHCL